MGISPDDVSEFLGRIKRARVQLHINEEDLADMEGYLVTIPALGQHGAWEVSDAVKLPHPDDSGSHYYLTGFRIHVSTALPRGEMLATDEEGGIYVWP